jgi:predicted metal-dependent peptidase
MVAVVGDHGGLGAALAGEGSDEAAEAVVEAMVSDATRDAPREARLAGTRPAEILETLVADGRRAVPIDWRRALQRFVMQHGHGLRWSYSRPNRRFPRRVGEIPSRSRLPTRSSPKVLVAIDTSASISGAELAEVGRQLVRAAPYAQLVITECDAVIHRTYRFEGELRRVMGRGGTDLRPPFAPAFLRRHGVGGVVYFTDGCGPFPVEPPPVPVLWVLSARGFACPWGRRVELST